MRVYLCFFILCAIGTCGYTAAYSYNGEFKGTLGVYTFSPFEPNFIQLRASDEDEPAGSNDENDSAKPMAKLSPVPKKHTGEIPDAHATDRDTLIGKKDKTEQQLISEVEDVNDDVKRIIASNKRLKQREIQVKGALMSHSIQWQQENKMKLEAIQAASIQSQKIRNLIAQLASAAKFTQGIMDQECQNTVIEKKTLPQSVGGFSYNVARFGPYHFLWLFWPGNDNREGP